MPLSKQQQATPLDITIRQNRFLLGCRLLPVTNHFHRTGAWTDTSAASLGPAVVGQYFYAAGTDDNKNR